MPNSSQFSTLLGPGDLQSLLILIKKIAPGQIGAITELNLSLKRTAFYIYSEFK